MPHAAISLLKGRSPQTIEKVAQAVQEVLASELGVKNELISVSVQEVDFADWNDHLDGFKESMVISPEFSQTKKIRVKPGPVARKPEEEKTRSAKKMKIHLYTSGIPATAILMNKIPPRTEAVKAAIIKEEASA